MQLGRQLPGRLSQLLVVPGEVSEKRGARVLPCWTRRTCGA
jgi:hypothetical protein